MRRICFILLFFLLPTTAHSGDRIMIQDETKDETGCMANTQDMQIWDDGLSNYNDTRAIAHDLESRFPIGTLVDNAGLFLRDHGFRESEFSFPVGKRPLGIAKITVFLRDVSFGPELVNTWGIVLAGDSEGRLIHRQVRLEFKDGDPLSRGVKFNFENYPNNETAKRALGLVLGPSPSADRIETVMAEAGAQPIAAKETPGTIYVRAADAKKTALRLSQQGDTRGIVSRYNYRWVDAPNLLAILSRVSPDSHVVFYFDESGNLKDYRMFML